ncbi:MAG: hypothetical protein CMC13_07020 [Flavobacteriaceae bacterium]|nr:hypothetical protein [Flavobacteriaceae bacterium]
MLSLTLFKTSFNKHGCKAIAYLFILLFTYAAVSKLLDFETFTVQLAQSPLLSAYAGTIAWWVPGVEIGIALLLFFPQLRIPALYACFTLMVLFTTYIFIILNFSDFIPCSCGGVLEQLSWTQHLIFNLIFIVLAGLAIFISKPTNIKKMILALATLTLIGTATVAMLFVFSEKKIHQNNAFQRRYPHHPATEINRIDITYNSYYIAGITEDSLFLGNTTAPLHVLAFSKDFTKSTQHTIKLADSTLPYQTLKTYIKDSIFFTFDGSIPILYKGSLTNYKTKSYYLKNRNFIRLRPITNNEFVIRVFNTNTTKNELGKVSLGQTTANISIKPNLLKATGDPFFDTDGLLLYNKELKKVVYVYFYRNEFVVTNTDLASSFIGKTIDTVSTSQLDVRNLPSKNQRKLGKQPLFVNVRAATYGDYLFIQSDRLGKNEPSDILDAASIIDVYNLVTRQYSFSFYLYHQGMKKLHSFEVHGNYIYALVDHYLMAYKLKEEIFKTYKTK